MLTAIAQVKKSDAYEQIVMAEVYIPYSLDADQEFMTPAEIKKLAYAFLGKQLTRHVDTNHDNEANGAVVVESFIAREGDPIFIKDSWVVAMWLPMDLFQRVLDGELNGFSIQMNVLREDKMLEFDLPEVFYGETTEVQGHKHVYKIYLNSDGNFGGGVTALGGAEDDQHFHYIMQGTFTGDAGSEPHHHNFEFISVYVDGNPVVLS